MNWTDHGSGRTGYGLGLRITDKTPQIMFFDSSLLHSVILYCIVLYHPAISSVQTMTTNTVIYYYYPFALSLPLDVN